LLPSLYEQTVYQQGRSFLQQSLDKTSVKEWLALDAHLLHPYQPVQHWSIIFMEYKLNRPGLFLWFLETGQVNMPGLQRYVLKNPLIEQSSYVFHYSTVNTVSQEQ